MRLMIYIYTWMSSHEMHSLIIAVYTDLGVYCSNAHMRPPLRTSGRKNKHERAINERLLETARWRRCHHRPCSPPLITAWVWLRLRAGLVVWSVSLHFSSSPSRQQQVLYLLIITQSGAGMLHAGVSRHAHQADDQTTRSMPKTD